MNVLIFKHNFPLIANASVDFFKGLFDRFHKSIQLLLTFYKYVSKIKYRQLCNPACNDVYIWLLTIPDRY